MEQNEQPVHDTVVMNKPSRGAIYLLIVVVIAIIVLVSTTKMPKNTATTEMPQDEQVLCYYSSTQTASGFNDVYSLKLSVVGTSATGELATAPAEKDRMNGTLSGTIAPFSDEEYMFSGTYMNSAEGMTNTDQRMIKLSATEAAVGYGETVQNPDGTYGYKDPANLNYSLTIPRVDCALYQNAY
ncbi:hypothetical protein K2Q02_00340 [Patescibacteria group bacterium]|nr:hypothetical protein [Patescibacteria group bacterium]